MGLKRLLNPVHQNIYTAILSNSYAPYFFFRFRFISLTFLAELLLTFFEVSYIFTTYSGSKVFFLLILFSFSLGATTFWWGVLESMRQRVRSLKHFGLPKQIEKEINSWTGKTYAFASKTLVSTTLLALLLVSCSSHLSWSFLVYFLFAQVRTLFSIFSTFYHSGAFGIQRIFRPFWSFLLVPVLTTTLLFTLFPIFGSKSFWLVLPVGLFLSTFFKFYYTSLVYKRLEIKIRFKPLKLELINSKDFLKGLAYVVNTPSVLSTLIYLFFLSESQSYQEKLSIILFLGLLQFAHTFAHIFYFDLTREEFHLFPKRKDLFWNSTKRLSIIVGSILAFLCALFYTFLSIHSFWLTLSSCVLLFVFPIYSLYIYRIFTDKAYRLLLCLGCLNIIGLSLLKIYPSLNLPLFLTFKTLFIILILPFLKTFKNPKARLNEGFIPHLEWEVATTPSKETLIYYAKFKDLKSRNIASYKLHDSFILPSGICPISETELVWEINKNIPIFEIKQQLSIETAGKLVEISEYQPLKKPSFLKDYGKYVVLHSREIMKNLMAQAKGIKLRTKK